MFKSPNNPLSVYGKLISEGKLNIKDSLDYQYTIKVTDFAGNEKTVRIPIKGQISGNIKPKLNQETPYFATASKAFSLKNQGIDVYIPANSLYEDVYLDISYQGDTIQVHRDDVPIHRNITIGFDVSKYTPEELEKLFIARISNYARPVYSTTYKKTDRFTTGTRTFGKYTLVADIKPPSISPVNLSDGQWISNNSDLKLKISDDLSGIKSYRATVNGKFILMEYEYKKNLLTHDFSDNIVTDTENKLKLIVTDNVGNVNTYEATFFRK